MPKSVRYACPSRSRSTFAGFTSRWTSLWRCAVEGIRDRGQDLERPVGRESALALEQRLQVAPVHEAHGEIELTLELARIVDGDHVRVVERRRESRLAQKARPELLVLGELARDQLERHRAVEA